MEELFNKPILDQMYEFRKEDFEQAVYDNNPELKEIETTLYDVAEDFNVFLKKVIPNQEDYDKAIKMFTDYDLLYSNEIVFWSKTYFKLGMIDKDKIRNEFFANKMEIKDNDTFLNYEANNFSDWLEEQKRKYTFETKEYKELQKKYNEISEKYPNAIEVFEDLKPINLNKEEMKALVKLRKIDIDMGYMEKDLCFKLGMKEVLNF
ncbi:MAG: DUF6664 family protein [Clostridia bacterium]